MKKTIIALLLLLTPMCACKIFACEPGKCWIWSYLNYQHNRMSINDRSQYIETTRHAMRIMHERQLKEKTDFNGGIDELDLIYMVKVGSYREMIKIYPCQEQFLKYLFFNQKMKGTKKE